MSYLGYWMGLEEERRTAQALEIESTFRMLKILTLQTAGNRQHRDRQHRDR